MGSKSDSGNVEGGSVKQRVVLACQGGTLSSSHPSLCFPLSSIECPYSGCSPKSDRTVPAVVSWLLFHEMYVFSVSLIDALDRP